MAKHKLKIARFANPSGEFSHRVSGTLNGRRIRKNFRAPTRRSRTARSSRSSA